MFLAQTTQAVSPSEWTPGNIAQALVVVMGAFATVMVPAMLLIWKAIKDAAQAKVQSEQNSKQITENRTIATSQLQAINANVVKVAANMPVPPKLEDFQEHKQ